ncbi:MAG: HAMP domain-containing histidine kinase [Actinomycetaceae bacterium]|nr:HAMP domain-containing histidine kinase [Actinomycetaceae bacterium]
MHFVRQVWRFVVYQWNSHVRLRVVTYVMSLSLAVMVVIGTLLVVLVRSSIHQQAVSTSMQHFQHVYSSAERSLTADSLSGDQKKQVTMNSLMIQQYMPYNSVMGAVFLQNYEEGNTGLRLSEPITIQSQRVSEYVSPEIREMTRAHSSVVWQAISYHNDDNKDIPGIIIGRSIDIPGYDGVEFYILYSLEHQQESYHTFYVWAFAGFFLLLSLIALIVYTVSATVVKPMKTASRKSAQLLDGKFDTRMTVKKNDELASLARSFNDMAEYIQEKEKAYEQLSFAQQKFVSAVSHELRSPVTTIRMAGQLLYDKRDELPSVLKRSVELQNKQLVDLDVLLSELLEISRYDAGSVSLVVQEVDVVRIIRRVIQDQKVLADSYHLSVVLEGEEKALAKVDPRRIERIVRNLVVNAIEHGENNDVRVVVYTTASAVAIEVSDRGIGLTEEEAKHVFDRFWRADESRVRKSGGTGLGLTIASEDAVLHGGVLECTGHKGIGSTFLLTLPVVPGTSYVKPRSLRVAAEDEQWGSFVIDDGHEESLKIEDIREVEELNKKIHKNVDESNVLVPSDGVVVVKNIEEEMRKLDKK